MSGDKAKRTSKSRDKLNKSGIKRKDIQFTKETYVMLFELAKASGHPVSKRKKNKSISLLLTQLAWECHQSQNKIKWDHEGQIGFWLARKASCLKGKGLKAGEIGAYLDGYKPSDVLGSKYKGKNDRWTKKSLNALIEKYRSRFSQPKQVKKKKPIKRKSG